MERLSIDCINNVIEFNKDIEIWQIQLLINELPEILKSEHEGISRLKNNLKGVLSNLIEYKRRQRNWFKYKQTEYMLRILQII